MTDLFLTNGERASHRYVQQLLGRLRRLYGDLVLEHFMPELSAFKVAVANRTPVQLHRPRSRAARLTQNLSREILDRTDVKTHGRRAA